jgi:hypothetical protein
MCAEVSVVCIALCIKYLANNFPIENLRSFVNVVLCIIREFLIQAFVSSLSNGNDSKGAERFSPTPG